MSTSETALVSVVTPAYNCGAYLAECIESVIAQTYSNWKYVIVDNASTDATGAIATRYADSDPRITVYHNESLLDIIGNHNRALSLISPDSRYCKVVSGDDWLMPECLTRMVALADTHPSVGIVGSYQLSGSGRRWEGWRVRWTQLPYPSTVVPGREACRHRLLGGPYVFGTPTSLLYRSDLIRQQAPFFPNSTPESDTSACFKHLKNTDFGFVHQVLSYERIHEQAMSTGCRQLNTYVASWLGDLIEYGPYYLTKDEMDRRMKELLTHYYRFLAGSVFQRTDRAFWQYHRKRLAELGFPLSLPRFAAATAFKSLDYLLNPKHTAETVFRQLGRSQRDPWTAASD